MVSSGAQIQGIDFPLPSPALIPLSLTTSERTYSNQFRHGDAAPSILAGVLKKKM
ncbi:MAG: hypothetical protein V7L29_22670 [Nostoc sp.]|uniref:hypothetical protein n=1 Tax=Nostoc sp. TaxID=1180 RepID=UPI002FFCA8B6